MRLALKLHPDSSCSAIESIEVEAARSAPGLLRLAFILKGDIAALRPPPETFSLRRGDELWRHSCLEAFVTAELSGPYVELNFSPAGEWAAYGFSGYRAEMTAIEAAPPAMEGTWDSEGFQLQASVGLPQLPDDVPWHIGMSAVIEDADGSISYWALGHPPGKADFHHGDCFALEVPAPSAP